MKNQNLNEHNGREQKGKKHEENMRKCTHALSLSYLRWHVSTNTEEQSSEKHLAEESLKLNTEKTDHSLWLLDL